MVTNGVQQGGILSPKLANSRDLFFSSAKTMSMCFVSKDMYWYKTDVKFLFTFFFMKILLISQFAANIFMLRFMIKNTDLDVKKQMRTFYASINTLVRKFGNAHQSLNVNYLIHIAKFVLFSIMVSVL